MDELRHLTAQMAREGIRRLLVLSGDDAWTLRAGIAYDDSPVPASHRSISIPDQDRLWLSTGATYAFNKDASVDVGVSYMHGQKVKFQEGPYTFSSEGKAWLYGANFNYAF